MNKQQVVLVVAAHPDDEVLGCGATMALHARQGDSVHVVFLADGVSSRAMSEGADQAAFERNRAAAQAAGILGVNAPRFLGLPDNRLDSLALLDIVQPLEAIIEELAPRLIYTNYGGDLNVDHRITNQAVITACRPQPGCGVREIYSFEVLSSTEWATDAVGCAFRPNCFVDISSQLEAKIMALHAYQAEMRAFPHSRSYEAVRAQAMYRGVSAGFAAAEAFVVERLVRSF